MAALSETHAISVARTRSRWLSLLVLTLVINLGSAFIFPHHTRDAFSWSAFLSCLAPIGWAAYLLLSYRTLGERLVSHAAIALALLWLLPAIGLVVEFSGFWLLPAVVLR